MGKSEPIRKVAAKYLPLYIEHQWNDPRGDFYCEICGISRQSATTDYCITSLYDAINRVNDCAKSRYGVTDA